MTETLIQTGPDIEIDYEPLPKQAILHEATEPFKAFIGGIGSGKSLWLCMDVFMYAMEWPETVQVITAPTYKMMRDSTKITWDKFVPRELYRWNARDNKYIFINGSEVWMRSSDDSESLRGPNLNRFAMDEASKDRKKTLDILQGRIRLVTKRADGKTAPNGGIIATTPKGFDYVWRAWVKNGKKGKHRVMHSASTENPYLPEDFVANLKEAYSEEFYDQEVLGLFTAHEGLVYKKFSRSKHVIPIEENTGAHKEFIGSIDWGYANPMVGLLFSIDGDERMHMVSEIYQKHLTLEEFGEKLRAQEADVAQRMNLPMPIEVTYFCDPADTAIGAGSMMLALRNQGFNIQKADNAILAGINAVNNRLGEPGDNHPRIFFDPSCENTISEFEQYSYDEHDEDKPFKDKPVKVNDHAMDAMRYAVMSRENRDHIRSFNAPDWL